MSGASIGIEVPDNLKQKLINGSSSDCFLGCFEVWKSCPLKACFGCSSFPVRLSFENHWNGYFDLVLPFLIFLGYCVRLT